MRFRVYGLIRGLGGIRLRGLGFKGLRLRGLGLA